MFIATANSLGNIHPALRDRMEIIEVNGYTLEEKYEIAKRHLIPKQIEENGIGKENIAIGKAVVEKLIELVGADVGQNAAEKLGTVEPGCA